MNSSILIHISHSSLYIPEEYRNTCLISQKELERENLFMCDTGVAELVPEALMGNAIIFPYSRLYCDVERFRDGSEPMDAYGMGYIYTRDSLGREIFRPDEAHRREVDAVYEEHHRLLDERVERILSETGRCLIIDLHSYSDEAVYRLFGYTGCPDVCIGVEPKYRDEEVVRGIEALCRACGISTAIDYPYKGSIVPNRYYGRPQPGLTTIMVEINKRILTQGREYAI